MAASQYSATITGASRSGVRRKPRLPVTTVQTVVTTTATRGCSRASNSARQASAVHHARRSRPPRGRLVARADEVRPRAPRRRAARPRRPRRSAADAAPRAHRGRPSALGPRRVCRPACRRSIVSRTTGLRAFGGPGSPVRRARPASSDGRHGTLAGPGSGATRLAQRVAGSGSRPRRRRRAGSGRASSAATRRGGRAAPGRPGRWPSGRRTRRGGPRRRGRSRAS